LAREKKTIVAFRATAHQSSMKKTGKTMTLPKFDYYAPKSIEEALGLLADMGGNARVMAGGTDLMVKMRNGLISPEAVIGLKNVADLDCISFSKMKGLTIGAGALLRDVAAHKGIRKHFPAIAYAAGETANVQIRNMGTVAGNLCNAAPSADNAPALIALGAQVTVVGPDGERTIALDRFFKGPGLTALEPGEILIAIRVPLPAAHSGAVYCHISPRSKVDICAVGVAAMVTMDGNACMNARVSLGAVAPIPMRAKKAEAVLKGKALTRAAIEKAGIQAAKESRPISDMRASARYRRQMVEVLTRRAIGGACRQVK